MSAQQRAALLADVTVIVRYPGYTRRAVIRQQRQDKYNRKRTKSGRLYAQQWYVVKWLNDGPLEQTGTEP